MEAQTKNKIIAEITVTAFKEIEQTVRKRLKRALPKYFLDKTTDETVKRIDESISATEKGKIERCQES